MKKSSENENNLKNTLLQWLYLGLPLIGTIFVLIFVISPPILKEFSFVKEFDFIDSIDSHTWNTLYSDPHPEILDWSNCKLDKDCPGNKINNSLRNSSNFRSDEHFKIVNTLRNRHYWISNEFSKEKVKSWTASGATQLFLGYFYASYEIFINGIKIQQGGGSKTIRPIVIRLDSLPEENIFLAVRFFHDMDEPYPDVIQYAGTMNDLGLEKHVRNSDLSNIFNSVYVGFSFALAIFFVFLWLTSWRKQEFAAYAALALYHATSELGLLPIFWFQMGNSIYHRWLFLGRWFEANLIIFLGLTISRIKTKLSTTIFYFIILLPLFSLGLQFTTTEYYELSEKVYVYYGAFAYLLATVLILYQAVKITFYDRHKLWDRTREHKLYASGVVFIILLISHLQLIKTPWDIHIALDFLLIMNAFFAVQDYRFHVRTLNQSPLSRYHKTANLVKKINCIVGSLDLKGSEFLYKKSAENGLNSRPVQVLIEAVIQFLNNHDCEIITTEGDSVIFFFEYKNDQANVMNKIINLTNEISKIMNETPLNEITQKKVKFRIAYSSGQISPIWQKSGEKQIPSWEQVGNSTVFIELARMLEAESKVMGRDESYMVLNSDLVSKSDFNEFEVHEIIIKHDQQMKLYFKRF